VKVSRFKTVGGYILAALAVPVVLAVFMGQNYWMNEAGGHNR